VAANVDHQRSLSRAAFPAINHLASTIGQVTLCGVLARIDRRPRKVFARAASKHRVMTRQRCARKISQVSFRLALAYLLLAVVGFSTKAKGEVELSIFTGVALTQDNDLRLQQNGGTDLTFHDVSYEGRDFDTPPYYGARALWFPSEASHWGFGAEFFHMKLYAETDSTVHVTGRRNGAGVDDNERIDNTIESFSLSHGLNYALGDIVYRWQPGRRGEDFLGHLEPYVGLGLGAAIPHVESGVNGKFHEEYQLHGPGVEALAGMNIALTHHIGLMFEYKFTYANLDSLDIPGGSIEVTPLTHHLVTGLTFSF
jgi:lipid A oxidase